jgi:wobble nucleotide-excising tRNase
MITSIQTIKKISCFDDFELKDNRPFQKVNIFYGNNGSGKTVISNILYLLSRHCKDKTDLLKELIDSDSELEVITDTGKITQKNISEKKLDLYAFNSKFISDSVYNGTTSNVDSFSSDIKLTNKEISAIDEKLIKLQTRQKKLNDWNDKIQEILDRIWKPYSDDFQLKVYNARLTGVKPTKTQKIVGDLNILKNELDSLYWSYDNVAKQAVTISRLESFKTKLNTIQNIELNIEDSKTNLLTQISTHAKGKIGDRIKSLQSLIESKKALDKFGDIDDWFKKGANLLHISKEVANHCPLCDTDLSENIDQIISDYSNYYSVAILKLFEFLDNGIDSLQKLLNFNFLDLNSQIAKEIVDTCNIYGIALNELKIENKSLLLESIKELIKEFKRKKQSPNETISLKLEYINSLERYSVAVNSFKTEVITAVDKEIEIISKKDINDVIKQVKDKIKEIVSVELNESVNNVFPSSHRSNSDISVDIDLILDTLNPAISKLEIKRSEEIAKLNAESKYMNIYLKYFGINHFSVDRVKDRVKDNIIITYLKTGKKKDKFKYSLSEGEKTALAFAYFISKLRVEKIEGSKTEFENCIIVIDDPISSLDDNRLFQTANLIESFLFFNKENDRMQPEQLFILSHNLVFIKYLYNALKTNSELEDKINEYYISNHSPYIQNLPSGLKNFTNTYIIKLKEIIDYKERRIEYETAKNYLPNYIRIVLETFLAFKLAMVNSNGRLPSLFHLIKAMVKEFENMEDKEVDGMNKDKVIERLNHLKKIADHESHGNIHKTEEFNFISEIELTEFAKHTLQVISYIDDFHFKKIKGHTS